MSIDTYPPQSTQATVTRTDTVMIQGGFSGTGTPNAVPAAWAPTDVVTQRGFWIVPEAYAGGDVTIRWLRRMGSSTGTAVFNYSVTRLRASSAASSVLSATAVTFAAPDTNSQALTLTVTAGTFTFADSFRIDMTRDADHASDTYALDVLSDGLSVTYSAYVMGYAAYPASVNNASYEEGSFTITCTGMTTTVTGTAYYARVGKQVTLYIPALSGTSNTTAFTLTGLPIEIQVARLMYQACHVTVGGTGRAGLAQMTTGGGAGFITLYAGLAGEAWTASGLKGLNAQWLSYSIL